MWIRFTKAQRPTEVEVKPYCVSKPGTFPNHWEMVNPRKNPMDLREPNFEIDSYTTIHVDRNRLNFVQTCD